MSMTGMDFAMGGGRVKYREIATAAANQTYAQQLTQLKTTWDTLTDEEKMRCVIYSPEGLVFHSAYFGVGVYACSSMTSADLLTYHMNIINKTYYGWTSSTNTVTTYSAVTHASVLKLMLLDVVSE